MSCLKTKRVQNTLTEPLFIGMKVPMTISLKELEYAHHKAPNKYLIQSEACIDSEVPAWKDDTWYWSKEATDWGYDWREAEQKVPYTLNTLLLIAMLEILLAV